MMAPDVVEWLLEEGTADPGVRSCALTQLLGHPADDPQVMAARAAVASRGPARAILDAQWPAGYWLQPGVGYSPKYKATVWQVIFLAALGMPYTEAVGRACAYVLDHSRLADGRFSAYKTAQGAVACLNGNLLRAMLQLGCQDPRLAHSLEALAAMATRDGFRCRYNAPSPPPARMGDGLPCAWGAIKALGALAELPAEQHSAAMQAAIKAGVALLLDGDLANGGYPTATRPSPLWHRFGFPLGYTSDLLEALDVLGRLGPGDDPRLAPAIAVVRGKQDAAGRWVLEYKPDNTWADWGPVGQPHKWVTLRALCVLQHWQEGSSRPR